MKNKKHLLAISFLTAVLGLAFFVLWQVDFASACNTGWGVVNQKEQYPNGWDPALEGSCVDGYEYCLNDYGNGKLCYYGYYGCEERKDWMCYQYYSDVNGDGVLECWYDSDECYWTPWYPNGCQRVYGGGACWAAPGCGDDPTQCPPGPESCIPQPPPPPPPPPSLACTVELTANPEDIIEGESSQLSWTTTNAKSCTADGSWSGGKTVPSGSEDVWPDFTTSYGIRCFSPTGEYCSDSAWVIVTDPIEENTKVCVDSCNSGILIANGSSRTMTVGQTLNLKACYNFSSECNDASGDVTNIVSWNDNNTPNNAVSLSGVNPKILTADNAGLEGVRMTNAATSEIANFTVNVSSLPVCTCNTGCETNTCKGTNCPDSCGSSVCPGTKNCSPSWREVAP